LALPDPDDETAAPQAVATGSAEKTADRKKKVVVASAVAAIIVAAGVIGLLIKNSHDTDLRNAMSASSSSKAAAARSAANAEADRVRRETAAERAERAASVPELEQAVKDMAEEHIAKGLFDGPALSVSCVPVDGGSTDDLDVKTTVFECFAATKDNGDGTLSGRKYHATMNWTTGEYTYGYGAPR